MLKKNDLIDYFYKGIKNKNDLRIGVEHEKFVLKKDTLKQLSYQESNGIKDIPISYSGFCSIGNVPLSLLNLSPPKFLTANPEVILKYGNVDNLFCTPNLYVDPVPFEQSSSKLADRIDL